MNITDIEELREAIRYCGITKELYGEKFQAAKFKLMKVATPELLSSILDLLEAERQRADELKINWDAAKNSIQFYKAEIDALKGDQVPVALIDERQGSGGFCLTQYGRRLNLQHGTELFTDGQKPVVPDALREDILRCVDDSMHGCNSLSAPDYAVRVAGWLSASGIVKDGE